MANGELRSGERVLAVDALRGFAVMGIVLLHNIEHFNFYSFPEVSSPFLGSLDKQLWDLLFFLFSGKAYAIFALLFGFTFYLQNHNCERRGEDFRNRYMWRLVLLLGFGFINASFFPGEILVLYALLGFVLVPVRHLSDKVVAWIAFILMLQPLEWCKVVYALIHPEANPEQMIFSLGDVYPELGGHSLWEMIKVNFVTGQLASLNWAWCYGRVFQTASLFMIGMLLGRKGLFRLTDETRTDVMHFWQRVAFYALPSAVLLYFGKEFIYGQIANPRKRIHLWPNRESIPEGYDANHLELVVQSGVHAGYGQCLPAALLDKRGAGATPAGPLRQDELDGLCLAIHHR